MPPKRTSTSNPSGNVSQTPASQNRPKKAPVLWEKDGTNGNSSIRIVLDWLAVEGNFQRWRGDTKGGLSKSALANKILDEMAKAGITHRDNKGIQTRIQDLQISYGKARDYLRGTGAGLCDEDIENGTTTLQAALEKRCKFYDELHAIMATRTCADPQHVRDSVTRTNPDLLNGTTPNDSLDSSTPRDSSPTPANPVLQTNKDTSNNTNNDDHNTSVATITLTVRGGGSKRKRSSKGCEPQGLEKVLSDSYKFRFDCFNAKERREDKRDKAREKREDKRDKRQAKRERKQNKIQAKREQVDAQIKLQNAETDEVGKRLQYVREMKDLGFDQAEIDNFMSNQFSQGEGSRHKLISDSSEDSSNESSEDLSDDPSSESSNSSKDQGNTEE
ncbi:hypothetical protein PCASD_11929 [Puccinia coronata f. sp. avenae]|uniref:Uncharacterized protein n=1 Tax=Puccinia coronata f. sp. avenae TaxID=200324 RepID=A0A2N5UWM8_9BASI|nr:hypothetical protein PCASD_11929 [Puccinia coronata f. sp. avenae]